MAKRLTKNQLDELLKIAKSPKGKKRELKMSEDRHQAVIIRYLKMQYAKTKFSVNPFSGVEIKGMDAKAKSIFLKRMKLQGWESGVPDIILHASRFDFSSLAIELKTFDWYPFRPWRKTNDFFIEHTKDNKYKDHIIDQLMFLHGMREEKSLAMFVPGHRKRYKAY